MVNIYKGYHIVTLVKMLFCHIVMLLGKKYIT